MLELEQTFFFCWWNSCLQTLCVNNFTLALKLSREKKYLNSSFLQQMLSSLKVSNRDKSLIRFFFFATGYQEQLTDSSVFQHQLWWGQNVWNVSECLKVKTVTVWKCYKAKNLHLLIKEYVPLNSLVLYFQVLLFRDCAKDFMKKL